MTEKRIKVILNPTAGRGKARRVWEEVKDVFAEHGAIYSLAVSNHQGEPVELARTAADEGYTQLVAVGGDGTLTEVVNGIMNSSRRPALGVIPAGSGNDLIRTLKIPKSPQDAARVVLNGQEMVIDIGMVNDNYFVNIAGVGVDAEVSRTVNEDLPHFRGTTAYIFGVLRTLITFKPVPAQLILDGEEINIRRMWAVVVGNGRFIGGGMKITPTAIIDDGWFEICAIRDLSRSTLIAAFPRIFSGSHVKLKDVDLYKARDVILETEGPLAGQADGETLKGNSWHYKIIPQALKVLVPG